MTNLTHAASSQSPSPALPAALAMFNLSGRTALITGSSAGIGLALAQGLLSAGARVVLNGRDEDKLQRSAERLRGFLPDADAGRVLWQPFDVTQDASVQAGVSAVEQQVGQIDILINNAGMTYRSPLDQFPPEQWQRIMSTNLDSAFLVSRAVVPAMIQRGNGKIVNICSVQSELGRPGIAPYAASKGALKMLTKGMAIDWGRHGIQVNGLGPGYFKTELTQSLVADQAFSAWLINRTPSARWGDVEDLVGAAIFLSSDASRFVNGHILYVDGGVTATL
jgi:gluconate 5-dehydrogenase